jgi:hypothetical protein
LNISGSFRFRWISGDLSIVLRQAFVYASTIQRMAINLFGSDAIFGTGDEEIDEDSDSDLVAGAGDPPSQ